MALLISRGYLWKASPQLRENHFTARYGQSLPPGPEQGCHPSERSDAGFLFLLRSLGGRQLCLLFSHGLAPQIDLVGVVNEPVQNGVCQSGVTDYAMPFLDG